MNYILMMITVVTISECLYRMSLKKNTVESYENIHLPEVRYLRMNNQENIGICHVPWDSMINDENIYETLHRQLVTILLMQ